MPGRGADRRQGASFSRPHIGFDIESWSDYAVAVVGGACALSGLLFVAVSVHSTWFSSSAAHRGRAGQALVLFVIPVVTGMLLLVPGQSTTVLGAHVCVLLAGLVNAWVFLLAAGHD